MKPSDQIAHIRLSDIDQRDAQYRIFNPVTDTVLLAGSIRRAGLIHPVWLKPRNGRYIILSGFNRVKAFEYNQHKTIPAFVVDADESTQFSLFRAIASVSFQRQLTPVELIRCVNRLANVMDALQIAQKAPDLFGRKLSPRYINELIAVGRLPDPALSLIDSGRMSVKAATRIAAASPSDISRLIQLFEQINASASVQLEILLHVNEICKRDGTTPVQLLEQVKASARTKGAEIDTKTRTARIREWLFRKRYPRLSQARDDTRRALATLNTGPAIQIRLSDSFEDETVHFSFSAKSEEEFECHLKRFKGFLDKNDALKRLFHS